MTCQTQAPEYVDETPEIVKKQQVDILIKHLDQTPITSSNILTVDKVVDDKPLILDAVIKRKIDGSFVDGSVKLLVYWKTHIYGSVPQL